MSRLAYWKSIFINVQGIKLRFLLSQIHLRCSLYKVQSITSFPKNKATQENILLGNATLRPRDIYWNVLQFSCYLPPNRGIKKRRDELLDISTYAAQW